MNTNFKRNLIAGLCLTALVAPVWAQQTITAQLDPQRISLGESAQLVVTVNGSDAEQSPVPQVDGLEIVPVGQQTSMQIINGNVTANVSQIFRVIPNRAGDFTIPAIGGSTQPIRLHVDKGVAGQTQRAMQPGRSRLPAPSFSQRADSKPVEAKNQSAFLRVVLPKQELTVGELVPVQVKAYFRAGVSASLNGLPVLSSDAFTLNKLGDQPEQTRELVNGVPYTVVTWTSALSAVKAGDYPLNLDLPVMVRVQEKSARSNTPFKDFFGDDSAFDDSFFDNFFGNATQKPLTLHTDGAVVKINALPTKGRSADFSGAVGQFEVNSEASTSNGTTGDPLTLKLSVTGRGNFDRVSTNGLTSSSDWKTYKPNGRFEPADNSGTAGTKTFEQSIVPMKAGKQEIPALRFSYFDPNTKSYVTKTAAPIAIDVAQGNVTQVPVSNVPAPTAEAPKTNKDGLAADKVVTGSSVGSLRPLLLAPWFITLNALMIIAVIVGAVVHFLRQRRLSDPERLKREAAERSVNEWLATMDGALKAQDAPRFFTAARRALQQRLAAKWRLPVSHVTIHEIRSRLNGSGEQIRSVFQTADEIAYSGRRFTRPDLQQWRNLVKTQLQELARP
jgi:hypothetical protein